MSDLRPMLRKSVLQLLPAGLIDDSFEIFYHGVDVYVIMNATVTAFSEWPQWLIDLIGSDLAKYRAAVWALDELGLIDHNERIWQYSRCRFGGYDGNPDITPNGDILHTEYWDCGFRCKCPYEGLICSSIKVKNGVLTAREIDIIRLVAEDLLNKEIADVLDMSEKTVPVHLQNIARKIGISNRRGTLIRFALQHNIIHSKAPQYDYRKLNF